MGVGGFMGELFSSNTIKLTNTGRPYLLRSAYLVNAIRAIQKHWGVGQDSPSPEVRVELRIILEYVREALEKSTKLRDKTEAEVDRLFDKAYSVIEQYISKHGIKPLRRSSEHLKDFQTAAANDSRATENLKNLKKRVKERLDIVGRLKNIEFSIILWPEKVRQGNGWASHKVPFAIEENATLDTLLVRVLCALPDLKTKGIPPFSLIQNPQFFHKFPHTLDAFRKARRPASDDDLTDVNVEAVEPLPIYQQMEVYEKVDINLIVDRKEGLDLADPEVSEFGDHGKWIAKEYKNIWKLDQENRYIVRQFTGALVIADPRGILNAARRQSKSTNSSSTIKQSTGVRPGTRQNQSLASTSQDSFSTDYSSLGLSSSVHSSRTTLPPLSESTQAYPMSKPTQNMSDPSFVSESPQERGMAERTPSTSTSYFPQTSSTSKRNPNPANSQIPTPPMTPSSPTITPLVSGLNISKPTSTPRVLSLGKSPGLKHQSSHTESSNDSSAEAPASPPPTPGTRQPKSQSLAPTNDATQTAIPEPFAQPRGPAAPRFMSDSTSAPEPIPTRLKPQGSNPSGNVALNTASPADSIKSLSKTQVTAPSKPSAPVSSPPPVVSPSSPPKPDESKATAPPPTSGATPVPGKSSNRQGSGPGFNNVGSASGRRALGTVEIVLPEKSGFFGGLKKKWWG
ncbi:hypothetical protein CPB83DRAFT_121688 [Crepidotus variabilis]|uniref:Uncharacterized protein n=1 Tax=Crepidotus variabilis TaxID=179855 RepID=A0A9P6JSM7_9AGAR|nr:hypothetical protein CPB83DRAFT_121688 [Crepidotus variabilis]